MHYFRKQPPSFKDGLIFLPGYYFIYKLLLFAGGTAKVNACCLMAAAISGLLAERGWTGKRVFASFISQYAANIFIVAFGALWLSASIGVEKAVLVGFVPFVIGALLKAILGTAVLYAKELSSRQ